MTMAVLSIVVTAPLGAILILALGPLLLKSDMVDEDDEQRFDLEEIGSMERVDEEDEDEIKQH